jgi:uncharacterized protein YggE
MKLKSIKFKNIALIIFFAVIIACNNNGKDNQSIISVSGIGTVMTPPDTAQIYLHFKNVSKTTEEAKNAVNESVRNVLNVLKAEDTANRNIRTVSLSYGAENEYRDGRVVYAGQRAEQNVIVTIDDIINNPDKLPVILDKLVNISNTSINDVQFNIKDKTDFFRQSRELAFQKAFDKAEQYALLSGKKIIGVQSISESNSGDNMQVLRNKTLASVSANSAYSNIPAGEQEITTEIRVEYKIK